jgi:diacylglycerol kinase family enzyme
MQKKINKNSKTVYSFIYYIGGLMSTLNRKLLQQEYKLYFDGEIMSGKFATVNIANAPCCGGNMSAVVTAMPNDGIIDAIFYRNNGVLRGLALIVPYTRGHFDRFPNNFTLKRGREITIRSRNPLLVNIDGEVFYATDITVKIVPAAVKIVAAGNLPYASRFVGR